MSCHIINLSLHTGIFHDCLKLALVTAIRKSRMELEASQSYHFCLLFTIINIRPQRWMITGEQ